jgi:hypothetical protein
MLIGARVAPFSPVGCQNHKKKLSSAGKMASNQQQCKGKASLPKQDVRLNYSKQQIYPHPVQTRKLVKKFGYSSIHLLSFFLSFCFNPDGKREDNLILHFSTVSIFESKHSLNCKETYKQIQRSNMHLLLERERERNLRHCRERRH